MHAHTPTRTFHIVVGVPITLLAWKRARRGGYPRMILDRGGKVHQRGLAETSHGFRRSHCRKERRSQGGMPSYVVLESSEGCLQATHRSPLGFSGACTSPPRSFLSARQHSVGSRFFSVSRSFATAGSFGSLFTWLVGTAGRAPPCPTGAGVALVAAPEKGMTRVTPTLLAPPSQHLVFPFMLFTVDTAPERQSLHIHSPDRLRILGGTPNVVPTSL